MVPAEESLSYVVFLADVYASTGSVRFLSVITSFLASPVCHCRSRMLIYIPVNKYLVTLIKQTFTCVI